jgi:MoxR-like ATPase
MNVILIGPTATGKSLCVHDAHAMLTTPKPMSIIEGHESMKEYDLLGSYVPAGGGIFTWEYGIIPRAMKTGAILFCDEANRMPTRTLNVLLGILSRRAIVLTEHGSEEIYAAEGFQVIMAMNLGRGYSVNVLDTALINRFDVTLEFRYLPPSEERELLIEQTGISTALADVMIKVAGETRVQYKSKGLSNAMTPRNLRAWAIKYQQRVPDHDTWPNPKELKEAAAVTWIPQVAGTDADGYVKEDIVSRMKILIEAHTPSPTVNSDKPGRGKGIDMVEDFRKAHKPIASTATSSALVPTWDVAQKET